MLIFTWQFKKAKDTLFPSVDSNEYGRLADAQADLSPLGAQA